jgi:hypothetical protein
MIREYSLFTRGPVNVIKQHIDLDLFAVGDEVVQDGSGCTSNQNES